MRPLLLLILAAFGAVWLFGPYEPVETDVSFDPRTFGDGVQVYLETVEAQYSDIKPGSEKRVIWRDGFYEQRTPVSLVYIHGFSANAQEIRPVPDQVAEALGANLVFTRLAGHGRTGEAMAEPTVRDWMEDVAEALAAGRAVGERVIVIATSTGGTLMAHAALDDDLMESVSGVVFVSPNFGINNPAAPLLTLPAARYWLPLLVGRERSFEPLNPDQAREWTTQYPTAAVFPMAALVRSAVALDYAKADVPALFYYSMKDQVVDPVATHEIQEQWGGPVTHVVPGETGQVDPFFHVMAGDILSPDNTGAAVSVITEWAEGLSP